MEQQILQLLQQSPDQLFSVKEVGKKVDRNEFRENANWARPHLEQLRLQGLIQSEEGGYYYFPKPKKKLGERFE
jgi:hypothetical protein